MSWETVKGFDKPCRYGGRVWIEQEGSKYALIVQGKSEAQSTDWDFILDKFKEYAEKD
jgi:hypothetical protein